MTYRSPAQKGASHLWERLSCDALTNSRLEETREDLLVPCKRTLAQEEVQRPTGGEAELKPLEIDPRLASNKLEGHNVHLGKGGTPSPPPPASAPPSPSAKLVME